MALADINCRYWSPTWKTEMIKYYLKAERSKGFLNTGVIIDVGANAGQTLLDTRFASERVRYIGFEPNPSCVLYLNRLVALNLLDTFEIVPCGLSNANTLSRLFFEPRLDGDSGATLLSDLRPDVLTSSEYVPCFRLDDLRETLKLTKISLIKIDVEGFELEVLMGMIECIKEFKPAIICEVLYCDIKADLERHRLRQEELMKLLKSLRYRVFQLAKSQHCEDITMLIPIDTFESTYWSEANKELCDYLFLPVDDTRPLPL